MRKVVFLLVLSVLYVGCVHEPVGERSSHDTVCGKVKGVEVRLRDALTAWPPPPLFTCPAAMAAVAQYAPVLREHWTVIFTNGAASLGLNRHGEIYRASGSTFPDKRLIVVNYERVRVLEHEFGHAYDAENGLPNMRDIR